MKVLDLIFPKKCLECGEEGKYICESCLKKVPPGGWTNLGSIRVYSVFRYKGVVRKAIIALKYKFTTEIADELISSIKLEFGPQNLIPIPSHWYKQNLRGFNQSELLGEKLAIKLGWKYIPNLLIKAKSTKSQVELSGESRRQNIKEAFSFNANSLFFVPTSVVIFDDVLTTGSTLKEAARVLKGAGVKKIWGLTIAK